MKGNKRTRLGHVIAVIPAEDRKKEGEKYVPLKIPSAVNNKVLPDSTFFRCSDLIKSTLSCCFRTVAYMWALR